MRRAMVLRYMVSIKAEPIIRFRQLETVCVLSCNGITILVQMVEYAES
ncbi:hypothetical protein EKH55_6010 (plasmid) [Sinorhizobium alkalisoli]|nr:hypothetical protein EKH55_6010 [Sinorhizobium alkalisoli]